jgi:hypothetical protein
LEIVADAAPSPVTHPLYKRVLQAASLPVPPFVDAAETIASLLVFPIIAFTGAVHGIGWAISISCVIANERRRHTYDVLGLLPDGLLSASWSLGTACLHRHRKFINITSSNALMGRIAILAMGWLMLLPAFISSGADRGTLYAVYGIAAFVALIIDHPQSIIISTLIGMLVPHHTFTRSEPILGAVFGCLALLISTYLITALVTFVILPTLYAALGITGLFAEMSIPLLGLGGFALMREWLIRWLWTSLMQQVNADIAEFDELVRIKV